MDPWVRPNTNSYPITYTEFEGKNVINGSKRKYWIQDLTPEYFEDVVKIYTTEYMKEEPLSKFIGVWEDADGTDEMEAMLRNMLAQKISLICLTKNREGEIKIAAFNCLFRQHKDDPPITVENQKLKKQIRVGKYIQDKRNIFEHLDVDYLLSAFGLYVLPEYRGENLGTEVLKARTQIGPVIGMNFTSTIFSSVISQKQAAKAGFEVFTEEDYEDIARIDKEMEIPNIHKHTKTLKVMFRKLP